MTGTRLAGPADRETVRRLLADTHAHYWHRQPEAGELDGPVADIVDRGACAMLLATAGEAVAGYATFVILHPSPNNRGVLFLKDLFVLDGHRGGGIGRRLLAALARIAAERGCARFDWTTETDNPGAQRLYERLGARRVEEKVYYRVETAGFADFIRACEG